MLTNSTQYTLTKCKSRSNIESGLQIMCVIALACTIVHTNKEKGGLDEKPALS